MEKFEVREISRELVKPSSPTPSHLKTFKLSVVDQVFQLFYTPLLLVYDLSSRGKAVKNLDHLKTTLSQTLSRYYPLAGRFTDESTISCDDQGIPLIVARVINCPSISTFLTPASSSSSSSDKRDLLAKFFPPEDSLGTVNRLVSEAVPLAFQVNVLDGGGVVIGCYLIHKILDGFSAALFLRHWASLAAAGAAAATGGPGGSCGEVDGIIHPDFDATVAAFPPCRKDGLPVWARYPTVLHGMPDSSGSSVMVKSFIFTPDSITRLRTRAASERVPNPTRFEALAGFIWERLVGTNPKSEPGLLPRLLVSTEMRSRCSPPLPKEAIGNLVYLVMAACDGQAATDDARLQELVAEIRATVAKAEDQIRMEFQGPKGSEAILAHHNENARVIGQYKVKGSSLYVGVSWSKVGFNEVDFGFRKPVWIAPTDGNPSSLLRKNNFILVDRKYDDEDLGIEAFLYLEEEHMQLLEADPCFLAFASMGIV